MLPRNFVGRTYEALSPKAREQLSGKVFNRLANLFRKRVYTLGIRIGGQDYRVSEAESVQFTGLVHMLESLFLEQHRGLEPANNMQIMGARSSDADYDNYLIVFFSQPLVLDQDLGRAEAMVLPEMFRRPMTIYANVFVNYISDSLAIHLQEIPDTPEALSMKAGTNAFDFAGQHGCLLTMKRCLGCADLLPILKKCGGCDGGFCDDACLKAAWPTHKAACKPRPKEDPGVEVVALALAVAERNIGCPCGHPTATLRCSRCKRVSYCSKACQLACWGFHRTICQKR